MSALVAVAILVALALAVSVTAYLRLPRPAPSPPPRLNPEAQIRLARIQGRLQSRLIKAEIDRQTEYVKRRATEAMRNL